MHRLYTCKALKCGWEKELLLCPTDLAKAFVRQIFKK
jgi:hypothetical protein